MSARFVHQGAGTADMQNYGPHAGIKVDSDDDLLKFKDDGGTVRSLVSANQTQTLTNKTLTAPVLVAPSGSGSSGLMITKSGILTELTGDGTYAITIPIPALATIHDIRVVAEALWTAATSAALNVGDTADADGYFAAVDLKATDLAIGEVLSSMHGDLWGGKNGAYLVAATGQRGPVATNFGPYYKAGSNIVFSCAKVGAGTAGRTHVSVTYSIGEVIAQVVT